MNHSILPAPSLFAIWRSSRQPILLFVHNPLMSLLPSHSPLKEGADCYFCAFFRSSELCGNSAPARLGVINVNELSSGDKIALCV
jgi:hypothetical protein